VILKHKLAYILFWANFSDIQHWIPFVRGEERHEMCDNFLKFASEDRIRLAPVFDNCGQMI
jgi:mannan endo-1,4-beta-mannosidase